MDQKPTVGRIVHYQSFGTPGGEYLPAPRAAVITQVEGDEADTVGLCILNPTGMFFNPSVCYSVEPKSGCWNWPPRVADAKPRFCRHCPFAEHLHSAETNSMNGCPGFEPG